MRNQRIYSLPSDTMRPRSAARWCAALGLLALLAGCSGTDAGAGDPAPASGEYTIAAGSCDPLRGAGTITNHAGEPAAFRVTVHYEYATDELRPLRNDTTPVLADGESFDFAIGPDPTGGSPSSCRIVGAERIEVDAADVSAVITREQAAPTAESSTHTVQPVWLVDGVGGSATDIAVSDGTVFLASTLPSGAALFSIELDTGELIWEDAPEFRLERLVPDGRGGVIAASGTALTAWDAAGRQVWQTRALSPSDDQVAASIDHLVVHDDQVIAGGQAPGAIAGIDLDTGEQRWYLHQDEAMAEDPRGFSGGGQFLAVTDHGLLVAGGTPSNRSLALIDLADDQPTVRWSVPDAGMNASTDGSVLVDTSDTAVTAYDVATGDELWSVSDASWERSPAAGAPAITDGVVIVARADSTIGFALNSGERLWEDHDSAPSWSLIGSDLRVDDRVVGMVSPALLNLTGADGGVIDIDVDADIRGTVVGAAIEDGRMISVARGSTSQQPSTLWLVDVQMVLPTR